MRSGQIQQVIAHGVPPFVLCRLVSKKIRKNCKRGGHVQDSIGAVFHSLSQQTVRSLDRSARKATDGAAANVAA